MAIDYRSAFETRNEDPDLHAPLADDKHYFPPELTPLLTSAEVLERLPPEAHREIEIHQLYAYLNFTVRLELGPVNEIATLLSHRAFLPQLPEGRRGDAILVIRDESKHAHWSDSVMEDVQRFTHVDRIITDPEFLRELNQLMAPEPGELGQLVKLMFVIVSETLITGSLSRLPKDEMVQDCVRRLAAAHASDEGQHHSYFRGLFLELWPLLPRQLQTKLGVLLPSMLRAFLAPDRTYLTRVLQQYPERFDNPYRVVDGIISSGETTRGMLESAKMSIKMFKTAGVFDQAVVRAAFEQHGFGEALV